MESRKHSVIRMARWKQGRAAEKAKHHGNGAIGVAWVAGLRSPRGPAPAAQTPRARFPHTLPGSLMVTSPRRRQELPNQSAFRSKNWFHSRLFSPSEYLQALEIHKSVFVEYKCLEQARENEPRKLHRCLSWLRYVTQQKPSITSCLGLSEHVRNAASE